MTRIVFDTYIESLPEDEQDAILKLSRTNKVFTRDANGELWQVLDLRELNEKKDQNEKSLLV